MRTVKMKMRVKMRIKETPLLLKKLVLAKVKETR
jgi:hypothetical protein